MKRERFDFVCMEAESGRDVFVRNPNENAEGRVLGCSMETRSILAETTSGEERNWDFKSCEEVTRQKQEWPRR